MLAFLLFFLEDKITQKTWAILAFTFIYLKAVTMQETCITSFIGQVVTDVVMQKIKKKN